jgi:hypothetical protein
MTEASPQRRPDLVVRRDDLPVTANDLARIIAKSGRALCRAGPVKVVCIPGNVLPEVRPMSPYGVVNEAHELARPVEPGPVPKPVTLPDRAARLYLALDDWGLAPLKGLTTAPLLSPDGSIRVAHGYDAQTGLWCCNVPTIDVPERPSVDDARVALHKLRSAFRTFPFADARIATDPDGALSQVDMSIPPGLDESASLVALLTALCRPSLPLAPGIIISAPSISGAGSGKGLLARAICEVTLGIAPHAFTACRDKGDLEKRIGAALIEGVPVLFLDNVNDTALRCDLLASVLTESHVKVRQLGQSRMLPLTPMAFVAVTGNGVTLSEDLVRRFVVIEFDPRMEDPESRPFPPGFLTSISARRGELLTAALTIWRWGRQNEQTIPHGRRLGSYEIWGRWVRDPLIALGCVDPVERIADAKKRDPRRLRIEAIYTEWWQCHRDQPVTASDLSLSVKELFDPDGEPSRQFIASELRSLVDVRVAGFVLTQRKTAKWTTATYVLRRTEADDPGRGPAPGQTR